MEALWSPGPDGIRALSPHHDRDLEGPVSWAGSESAGLTYLAISRFAPRNLWRDSSCPITFTSISSANVAPGFLRPLGKWFPWLTSPTESESFYWLRPLLRHWYCGAPASAESIGCVHRSYPPPDRQRTSRHGSTRCVSMDRLACECSATPCAPHWSVASEPARARPRRGDHCQRSVRCLLRHRRPSP